MNGTLTRIALTLGVSLMLSVVSIVKKSRGWYESGAAA